MRFLLTLAMGLVLVSDAESCCRHGHRRHGGHAVVAVAACTTGNCGQPAAPVPEAVPPPKPMPDAKPTAATDALDQLNAQRAARGLPAYVRDEGLTVAAIACATHRARFRIAGHCMAGMGDFVFVPATTTARCAGCSAWPVGLGFGACEAYSTAYRFAGAATVIGPDGLAYNQAFYR